MEQLTGEKGTSAWRNLQTGYKVKQRTCVKVVFILIKWLTNKCRTRWGGGAEGSRVVISLLLLELEFLYRLDAIPAAPKQKLVNNSLRKVQFFLVYFLPWSRIAPGLPSCCPSSNIQQRNTGAGTTRAESWRDSEVPPFLPPVWGALALDGTQSQERRGVVPTAACLPIVCMRIAGARTAGATEARFGVTKSQ